MNEIKHLTPFRFWAQKVIPLVYDESLSYYELLCKVIDYLNKMGGDFNSLLDNFTELSDEFKDLVEFAYTQFPEYVNNKLDEMAEDGTLTRLIAPYLPFVTPEMFGAVGDGINDDTLPLQNCLDNGNYVVLTKIYKISSGLLLHSNLIIDGFNKGKIIKDSSIATDYSSLYYYDDSVIKNVKIMNLELTGLKHWTGVTITGYANDYGIRIINAENVDIKNNKFVDFGACSISIYGKNVIIDSNIIEYTGQFSGNIPNYNYGINYDGEDFRIIKNTISGVIIGILSQLINKNVVISENDISTNGQHGLYMEGADNVVVSNNTIHDCTLAGVKFQRDSQATIFRDIVISDNVINNCIGQGILLESLVSTKAIENALITGNVITHSDRCIDITRVYNCTVQGNILYNDVINTERYLVYSLNSNNIKIDGNKLTAINGNAIWFNDAVTGTECNNISISNNDIKMSATEQAGTNYTGIRVRRGDNLYINGNTLIAESDQQFGTPYDGIFIENTSTSINRFFILNSIMYGFRWDIRLGDNTNANVANCYYTNALGVS